MDRTVSRGSAGIDGSGVRVEAPLPHTKAGPSLARRRLEEALASYIAPSMLGDLCIIASELVANSVVHGRLADDGKVLLRIDLNGERVRLETEDRGRLLSRGPRPKRPSEVALGGRGLTIVDALADRWGVLPGRPTVVWTEVDLPARAS